MAAAGLGVGAPNIKIRCSLYHGYPPWADRMGGEHTRGPTSIPNARGNCGILQCGRKWDGKRIEAGRSSKDSSSNSPAEEERSSNLLLPKEDVDYLWKLGAGTLVGAAAIKYGSALFPEITTPNLLLALIIIFTPVVVATLLLFNQSRS